ncbi:hypothetical protein NU219Hw_g3496t1 [Hortaea werneckii]
MADAQEASLDSIDTDATFESTDSGAEDRFHAQWQQEDTAHLQPSNLPITRVQRAWERRPLSPLSRRKLRVGKVWKRPSQTQNQAVVRPALAAEDGSGNEQRGTKRSKTRSSVNSPLKPVKKLCMDSDYGLAPRVAVWDGRPAGSPTRKIVTRSRFANGDANEELLELDEDEIGEGNAQYESKIEFFDDQGAVLDEDSADGGAWEDEEVYDPTMMHLEDAVYHEEVPRDVQHGQQASQADIEHQKQADSPIEPSNQTEEIVVEQKDNAQGAHQNSERTVCTFTAPRQAVELPEGFVSPIRQRRKLRAGSFKKASGSRRETLPAQFAPPSDSPVTTGRVRDAQMLTAENAFAPNAVSSSHAEPSTHAVSDAIDGLQDVDAGREAENEWEDVEDEVETMSSHHPQTSADEVSDDEHSTSFVLPVDSLGGAPASDLQTEGKERDQPESGSVQDLPPSPANTAELPPTKVALRHSPRRKSTSPLKPSALAPRADQPHYVAFTPIKQSNLSVYKDVSDSRGQGGGSTPPSNTSSVETSSSSVPDRALSAPAEEPSQMSPRRQPKPPRVSDDTALLQAFLNRAAERRSGRRVSATEQEALFHRRDSDVVKAALASPGKALDGSGTNGVLGELDSNTHSPKRTASTQSEVTGKDVEMTDKPVDSHAAAESVSSEARNQELPEDPIEEAQPAASNTRSGSTSSASRRSDRSRRKPQALAQQASTGPSRITIRGPHQTNAGISESNKRTEAQELALATKNNTRKNKGGSVLPMQRLNKLAKAAAGEVGGVGDLNAEAAAEEFEDADTNGKPGKKGVRWAETLVSFYQGSGTLADLAQLSDAGAEERMPWERPALASDEEETDKGDAQGEISGEVVVPAAPAPADTPSKPKGKTRKTRTPRTASAAETTAPGTASAAHSDTEMKDSKSETTAPGPQQPQEETHPQPSAKPRTASQARRSRIATPAKSSTASAQPPPNVPQQHPPSQPAAESVKRSAPPPRKRTMASRLPAPSSASTTSSTAATVGSGKENLISSPPKKRTAAPSQQQQQSGAGIPSSKNFVPKLDFNDHKPATKFEQPTPATAHSGGTSTPGLHSPARKTGARRAGTAGAGALFSGSSSSLRQQEGRNTAGGGSGGGVGQGEGDVPMGLRSPAKRRVTRRTNV